MLKFFNERLATLSLAAIMSFRMLGLFMILPVFSVEAHQYLHANIQLMGIALGIYGFTQACLQIPLGALSDRIGRKSVITFGLILFMLGSILCALSTNIYMLILGRALQGAGAIGSTTLALLADLTRDENRSKAMAIMGLTIGCSFSIAMILGPLINTWWHLSGIFWLTAFMALAGIFILQGIVPTPPVPYYSPQLEKPTHRFRCLFKNRQLWRLNMGIFSLHATITALFIALPILLNNTLRISQLHQSLLYLGILFFSFFLMFPFIIIAEKKRQMKPIFLGAILTLLLSQLLLGKEFHNIFYLAFILLLFFTAFTLLEAILPSWISKITPIHNKGAAMGLYSSSQFLGIFFGGTLGGLVYHHFALQGILFLTTGLLCLWLIVSFYLESPPYLTTVTLQLKHFIPQDPNSLLNKLHQLPAISEAAIMHNEGLVYLKIKQQFIAKDELPKLLEKSNLIPIGSWPQSSGRI